ncbi:archaeosine biosynthesis radical SAM protein RaSEA [Methanobrevibacter sp. TMH8]|uniref:archaeosine biosynthesis radical SAM protein RaSEA n=1 Tax=Methanobrevibacter sp. TMH8 TaxID=2848611 RepID=UPI001CCD9CD3|nr:archaeosine biosynthesis radical SAM protein RaSEA [Methanobrevibacter sp. TMH8]MBZ9570842.1 archaeosine biosynthesis radical SAM protein RaSEA [Methanobrevibacter sp. TMH8]
MEIQKLTKEIRDNYLERMKVRPPEKLATSWYQEDLLYAGAGKSLFIIVPTPGCSWALSQSGGCTMCSYISDCTLEPISADLIIKLFNEQLGKYIDEIKSDGKNMPIAIKIFASGSFLNSQEVPKKARDEILNIIANIDEIKEVIVESRPEYVNEEVLKEIFSFIPEKLFEVSMGLESENDFTREEKINKGFTKEDFEKAVNILAKINDDNDNSYVAKSKAYIFVKPILTSEKEAIDEAIATAKYCETVGVNRVSFCPATIHRGTLIERLWRKGAYQPPWIWSVIEIINETRKNLSIPAFMDTSGFGSRRGPYNCKKCNKDLKHKIIYSNIEQIPIEDYDCQCKKEWIAEIESSGLNKSKTRTKNLPLI